MAKRYRGLGFDQDIFKDYAERLEELNGDLRQIFTSLLEQTAETVEYDTEDAMSKSNLPARGKYSKGDTKAAIVRDAKITWSGTIGEVPLGFDWNKDSAAGYLISGTPRMRPNWELEDMYVNKKYNKNLIKDMQEHLTDEIKARMEK